MLDQIPIHSLPPFTGGRRETDTSATPSVRDLVIV
jgi:hypothetical protein